MFENRVKLSWTKISSRDIYSGNRYIAKIYSNFMKKVAEVNIIKYYDGSIVIRYAINVGGYKMHIANERRFKNVDSAKKSAEKFIYNLQNNMMDTFYAINLLKDDNNNE